jgi:hypothetical protein
MPRPVVVAWVPGVVQPRLRWSDRAPARQQAKLARGVKDKEHAMSQTSNTAIAVIGIDIGKNLLHV